MATTPLPPIAARTVMVHVRPDLVPVIHCDPTWLDVNRPEGTDKKVILTFKLVPPIGKEQDYTFPALGGIVIVNEAFPQPCTTTEPTPLPAVNITEVQLVDVNTRNADFSYKVLVLHRDGRSFQNLTEDPFIRNGP
jgi:hypothetical protein